MLPEIFPSIPIIDIEKIGQPFEHVNTTPLEETLTLVEMEVGSVKSIYVRLAVKNLSGNEFGQFEFKSVFYNNAGVIEEKLQIDAVTNSYSQDNLAYFKIVGQEVHVMGVSGILTDTKWVGMIAVIAV